MRSVMKIRPANERLYMHIEQEFMKILIGQSGEFFCEMHNIEDIDPGFLKHGFSFFDRSEMVHFFIGMKKCPWIGIEQDRSRWQMFLSCFFQCGLQQELMSFMKSIKKANTANGLRQIGYFRKFNRIDLHHHSPLLLLNRFPSSLS